MTDILDLPGWAVIGKREDVHEYEIEAEFMAEPEACNRCGVIGRLYRHGTHATTYRDSPIRGHTVRILVKVRRYKCRDCGEAFRQQLTGISDTRHMTERCAEFIQKQCLLLTFLHIADTVGCDEKTVRTLASEHIARVDGGYLPALPEWLGIDETQIDGKMRLTYCPDELNEGQRALEHILAYRLLFQQKFDLVLKHVQRTEPMQRGLDFADMCAGAAFEAYQRGDSSYLDILRPHVIIKEFTQTAATPAMRVGS